MGRDCTEGGVENAHQYGRANPDPRCGSGWLTLILGESERKMRIPTWQVTLAGLAIACAAVMLALHLREAKTSTVQQCRTPEFYSGIATASPPPLSRISASEIPTNGLMPGAHNSVESCFQGPVTLVAACEAVHEAQLWYRSQGIVDAKQDFKLLEVYYGDSTPGQQPGQICAVVYSFMAPFMGKSAGRVIRVGERVIWVWRKSPDNFYGKALPDTPENRAIVQKYAKSISHSEIGPNHTVEPTRALSGASGSP